MLAPIDFSNVQGCPAKEYLCRELSPSENEWILWVEVFAIEPLESNWARQAEGFRDGLSGLGPCRFLEGEP